MAELKRDRVRASKLRAKKNRTPEQDAWLADYERRVTKSTIARAKAMPSSAPYTATAAPRSPSSSPLPPREQLALIGEAPSNAPVHTTEKIDDALSPDAFTWEPKVPPPPEGADAPPPGAPQPPTPGAPIIDDAPPTAPQGDPAAAAQFAGIVVLITGVGIGAALELTEGAPIPEQFRALMESPESHKQVLQQVGAAAERVAIKHGFRSVPFGDEAIVLSAVGGSVVAWLAVQKRKRLKKPHAEPAQQATTKPEAPEADLPPELAKLFEGQ